MALAATAKKANAKVKLNHRFNAKQKHKSKNAMKVVERPVAGGRSAMKASAKRVITKKVSAKKIPIRKAVSGKPASSAIALTKTRGPQKKRVLPLRIPTALYAEQSPKRPCRKKVEQPSPAKLRQANAKNSVVEDMKCYETLGLCREAIPSEIVRSYRNHAIKQHPDTAGGSAASFLKVARAFETLAHNNTRVEYDRMLEKNGSRDGLVANPEGAVSTGDIPEPNVESICGAFLFSQPTTWKRKLPKCSTSTLQGMKDYLVVYGLPHTSTEEAKSKEHAKAFRQGTRGISFTPAYGKHFRAYWQAVVFIQTLWIKAPYTRNYATALDDHIALVRVEEAIIAMLQSAVLRSSKVDFKGIVLQVLKEAKKETEISQWQYTFHWIHSFGRKNTPLTCDPNVAFGYKEMIDRAISRNMPPSRIINMYARFRTEQHKERSELKKLKFGNIRPLGLLIDMELESRGVLVNQGVDDGGDSRHSSEAEW